MEAMTCIHCSEGRDYSDEELKRKRKLDNEHYNRYARQYECREHGQSMHILRLHSTSCVYLTRLAAESCEGTNVWIRP